MNNTSRTIKTFTCCRCLYDFEVMSDLDTRPLFLCDGCRWHDRTRTDIVVTLNGAPAGKVTGTSNPCHLKNVDKSFTKQD